MSAATTLEHVVVEVCNTIFTKQDRARYAELEKKHCEAIQKIGMNKPRALDAAVEAAKAMDGPLDKKLEAVRAAVLAQAEGDVVLSHFTVLEKEILASFNDRVPEILDALERSIDEGMSAADVLDSHPLLARWNVAPQMSSVLRAALSEARASIEHTRATLNDPTRAWIGRCLLAEGKVIEPLSRCERPD